jgi:molybdate transport system ATP-binding protein
VTEPDSLKVRIEAQVGRLQLELEFQTRVGPLVLVGPNGAGKTSLLLMLLGVLSPRRGVIALGAETLLDTAAGVDVPVEQRRLGYVPQNYALFPHLSVRQNIEFALGSCDASKDQSARAQRVDALLQELKLEAQADRRSPALSGGEKQRVAIARALAVRPRALLFDEPLAALDVHARREVRAFLAEYLAKVALPTIIVTHDPVDARVLAERIAVVELGRIVQIGTWSELEAHAASAFVAEFVAAGRLQ